MIIPLNNGQFNVFSRLIYSEQREIQLSLQETEILVILASNKNEIISRDRLFYRLWGKPNNSSRVVDMHISSLRKKIARLSDKTVNSNIISFRKRGYMYKSTDCG